MQIRMVEIDNGPGGVSWESSSDTNVYYASYETRDEMMTDAIALFRHGIDVRFVTLAEYELEAQLDFAVNGG